MKYQIVQSYNEIDFVKKVNEELKDGWELVGGVCVAVPEHAATRYAQAMIMRDKDAN